VTVLVSVPYYQTPFLIRRAVDLLLAQTYPDLRVVVTNDADRWAPWPFLADIKDDRLVRFSLTKNLGRYYADAVALAANPYSLFSVHDSDDWSETTRFAHMMDVLNEADAVCDGFVRHGSNGQMEKHKPRPELIGYRSGRSLWHFAHHKAIWKTEALRPLGMGPRFRVGWDTYLMHFAALALKVEWVKRFGYHQERRKGSLTQSATTGIASKHRADTIKLLDAMWNQAQADPTQVFRICAPEPDLAAKIEADAARLRELL
jgi:hypothetical protein